MMVSLGLGGTLWFLLISATAGHLDPASASPVTCSSEGAECDNSGDNLLDAVMHVMILEECRQMCLDDDNCGFISYFGEDSAPFSHLCQLFTSCDAVNNCSHCVSENMACFRTCGSNTVGDLDENVVDLITNVESELACKQLCLNTISCSFYTFYFPNDTLVANYCFLQTEFVGPAQPCTTCVTAPIDCTATQCSLTMDGEEVTSLMLTSVDQTKEISVKRHSGWQCELTFLVVGGGGRDGGNNFGGAGSGYLEYHSVQLTEDTVLTARVGDQGQASSVSIRGGDTVTAQPGQDGQGDDGGDGYSGGGANGSSGHGGDGGSDGGNGENGWIGSSGHQGTGGSGTGEDISVYSFTTWTLAPGDGGVQYSNGCGGGGGGILVDGEGPRSSEYRGQGYGGGAAGCTGDVSDEAGLQGVILIEIN